MVARRLTGNHRHFYLNPQRSSHPDALRVHGLSDEFLADKPRFDEIAEELLAFLAGAEIVIHNALYPGKSNSLDALCKRLAVDNSARTLHGALLDAGLLADVYIGMTRGQGSLVIDAADAGGPAQQTDTVDLAAFDLPVPPPTPDELAAHRAVLADIHKASRGRLLWQADLA